MNSHLLRIVPVLVLLGAISGCGSDNLGKLGDKCSPADSKACAGGLICAPDDEGTNRCLIPIGSVCNLNLDNSLCESGSACFEMEDGTGLCLITHGGVCSRDVGLCGSGLVCAETEGEEELWHCFYPVVLQGIVFDAEASDPIEGAHVIGLNEEGSAITDIAVSGEDGMYECSLPVRRDIEGKPARQFFTLRAEAQDYQSFPGGVRTPLPIDASLAAITEGKWVIQTAQTDVALFLLPQEEQGAASVSGRVVAENRVDGVLVVAERANQGVSAVSSRTGHYHIFNVPPGNYTVRGYAAHLQLDSVNVVVADEDKIEVDLHQSAEGIADVKGQIQIVSAHGSLRTSVVLMVASTFNEVSERGEVPVGLRAPRRGEEGIKTAWSIDGVPAGEYVVMAGYENDHLVRNPDENVAGTDILRITVPAEDGEFQAGDSFKVTAALETVLPGAEGPQAVDGAPVLEWGPNSNAEHYSVLVYDSFGEVVWEDEHVDRVGGGGNITRLYEGPLDVGMYYQYRATAWRRDGPISTTEILRGVFFLE